ncbi:G patch domain-containing protein 1 homolog [Anopheles darlingi]|uniref:G patch domain-containing protein 1 homolog n=1 Tax=Anopheles darlingi TaxID=43151 RepID=UPI00210065B1|nr:G patch domain-containing protein 1 homolog [Anopheles darlingi]
MENDEETLCRYGTALPAFEEDAVPSKKPITVEDQIVLDSNGKRRFHGAFTGGFSAGYWNTVGSEEGWKPSEFKSSRLEKAQSKKQNPIDFMDEEDLGEFGIAPQRVQTRDDFAHSSSNVGIAGFSQKRRLDTTIPTGPIPGQPVLRTLLEPAKEKTAVRMLKQMGWREGQGIGERQKRGEKRRANERNTKEQYVMKMYGCAIPGHAVQSNKNVDVSLPLSDSDDGSDYDITFAPDDFDPLVVAIKDNTFGLGYNGLDRVTAKGFNLFDTLEVVDRNNKKLSIRGQAFGIGALEDDDDVDVYARDDMSRYDFSLDDRQAKEKQLAIQSGQDISALEGFCTANKEKRAAKKVFRSTMPENFRPRNWLERRSRFDALDEDRASRLQHDSAHKIRGLGRHDLDPKRRAEILGEVSSVSIFSVAHSESSREPQDSEQLPTAKDNCAQLKPSLVIPSGLVKEAKVLQQPYVGSTKEGFKPFIAVPDKQERYEHFLAFQPTERYLTREQFLESLQPLSLSAWERERELKEFIQAERMYRPLGGLMSDRFVTASMLIADNTITTVGEAVPSEIKMKRTRTMWKPHKDICKRFNVPEPFGGMMVEEENVEEKRRKEKAKFSVFDYLEMPVTNRRDFVTPVVIPAARVATEQRINSNCPIQPLSTPKASVDITDGQRVSSVDFFKAATDPNTSTLAVDLAPAPPKKIEKKRTELEELVIAAAHKKPQEKRDLFKSIFCSSSGDEEEQDHRQKAVSPKDKQPTTLTDAEKLKLVDSFVAIKPAGQLNILRNDSPPRGIFKSLFESWKPLATADSAEANISIEKKTAITEDSSPSTSECDKDEQCYGPKLPASGGVIGKDIKASSSTNNERLQHLVGTIDGAGMVGEEWVEKGVDKKGKKKKKHRDHHSKSSKHKKNKKKHSKKHSRNTKR